MLCLTISTSFRRTRRCRRQVCHVRCAKSSRLLWPGLLMVPSPGRPTPGPCPGVHGYTHPEARPRGPENQCQPCADTRASRSAHLLHQLLHPRPAVAPSRQIREQPPFPDSGWEVCQLTRPLHGDRTRLDLRVYALVLERVTHRLLREAAIHTLGQQVFDQSRRAAPAGGPQRRVLAGEPPVVHEPAHLEPP